MLKFRLVIFAALLSMSQLHAQQMDVGLQFGGGFYDGDLSLPTYFSNARQMNVAVGLLARMEVLPGAYARFGCITTKLEAHDNQSSYSWQLERDLSFESQIFEVNLMMELHPFRWMSEFETNVVSPYIFGGIGFFSFNPKSEYNGQMVELQPLGTEGQGMPGYAAPYDLNSLVIPFGIGVRLSSGPWMLDLEYGARRSNTDYLDDISGEYVAYDELLEANGSLAADLGNKVNAPTGAKRGNSDVKDWYAMPVLTIGYRLGFNNTGYISGRKVKKAKGCPTF